MLFLVVISFFICKIYGRYHGQFTTFNLAQNLQNSRCSRSIIVHNVVIVVVSTDLFVASDAYAVRVKLTGRGWTRRLQKLVRAAVAAAVALKVKGVV